MSSTTFSQNFVSLEHCKNVFYCHKPKTFKNKSTYIVFECLKFIKINAIENRKDAMFGISLTDRKVSQQMKMQKLLVQGLLSVPWGENLMRFFKKRNDPVLTYVF